MKVNIKLQGKVQGVGFRWFIKHHASKLNILGYVKNKQDSSLEAYFDGPDESINKMLELCKKGPPGALIDKMDISEQNNNETFNTFEIRSD